MPIKMADRLPTPTASSPMDNGRLVRTGSRRLPIPMPSHKGMFTANRLAPSLTVSRRVPSPTVSPPRPALPAKSGRR